MRTQLEQIMAHLESGRSLTTMQAFRVFGVTSLAKRICELREEGVPILKEPVKLSSGRKVIRYSIDQTKAVV